MNPTFLDSDIIDDWGLKWVVAQQDTTVEDREVQEAVERAIAQYQASRSTTPSPVPSRPFKTTSGHVPLWFGRPGFEANTAAYLERVDRDYLSDYPFSLAIFADDEE